MNRIAAGVLASFLATTAFAAEEAAPVSATITGQEGTVLVNQGEQFVTASDAQALIAGNRVMVMEGGSAEITFADGCVLPLASGSLLEVPAVSTCASKVASVQRIGPSYAQAVGDSNDDDPSTAKVTFWVGAALIAIVATAGGDSDPDPFPPPASP